MTFDDALEIVDSILSTIQGKPLNNLQTAILESAWFGQKYAAIAQAGYCTEGHVKDVAADLWKRLSEALGARVGKKSLRAILEHRWQLGRDRVDWGEAPSVSAFVGREGELSILEQWIQQDRCRLITVLGMGGIGKTALVSKLAHQLEITFDYVIWRSLRNAPPVNAILSELIQGLSSRSQSDVPRRLDSKILKLLEYLRSSRCLIILDNLESILHSGPVPQTKQPFPMESYRAGYEDYDQLLTTLGESSHKSCLLLTSREKSQGLALLEGKTSPVRSLQLKGLSSDAGKDIFQTKGDFTGSVEQWQGLIGHYGGNPLALKIVAVAIADLFDGNLANFLDLLKQGPLIFDDIRTLLQQQFQRLTAREQEIMYWLAINREPVSLQELATDIVTNVATGKLLHTLSSLQRRSLIEKTTTGFTQQPVVMEYMTHELIEQMCAEIISKTIKLFREHALVKAQAKDYLRDTQIRLILQPIIEKTITTLGSPEKIKHCLAQHLDKLRGQPMQDIGYAGGNSLNLLRQLGVDFRGYDFSQLAVWQANCQELNLQHVNFAGSDLAKSVFSETLESVLSVAISPNGQLLATGDVNGHIRLWQLPIGKPLLTIKGHTSWVRAVTFSPDSQNLASSSYDKTIKLWDCCSGSHLTTYSGHSHGVASVTFSPDGQTLASGSYDRTIKLWSISNYCCLTTFAGHSDWVNSVAFSPAGQLLASGSADHTIKLWNIHSGHCLRTYTGHGHGISSVAFSPQGHRLASGSADHTVKLWSIRDESCISTFVGHGDWVNSVAFGSHGHSLVSGSADGTVKLWDISRHRCLRTCTGHGNAVWSVAVYPHRHIIASGSYDQTVRLWDSHTGQCLKTLAGYTNWIRSVAFSPVRTASPEGLGQTLVSGHTDRQIRVWHLTSSDSHTLVGHTAQVCAVAVSAAGNTFASGSYDQTIKLWDSDTGENRNTLMGHQGWVCSVAFSGLGNRLEEILASGSFDHTVKLWDIHYGHCFKTLSGHGNVVWDVAFSPVHRGQTSALDTVPSAHVGQLLASASADHTVKLWDIDSGHCLKTFSGHQNVVWAVAFSPMSTMVPDGTGLILASASADRTIKLWDVVSGSCLRTYTGHQNWVFDLAFSPDGQTLASGSHDHTVKLWAVDSGQCLFTFMGHNQEVYSVAFSPDGQTLASGAKDGTLKLWDIETGKCLQTLMPERLYEGMNITGAKGLTDAQKATLKILGAKEHRAKKRLESSCNARKRRKF